MTERPASPQTPASQPASRPSSSITHQHPLHLSNYYSSASPHPPPPPQPLLHLLHPPLHPSHQLPNHQPTRNPIPIIHQLPELGLILDLRQPEVPVHQHGEQRTVGVVVGVVERVVAVAQVEHVVPAVGAVVGVVGGLEVFD